MHKSIDQVGRKHNWCTVPNRIVSLVPSITELLCDMGLERSVVGCTKFCVHPSGIRKKLTVVGGTKNINLDKISDLMPDIIIANKEENRKEDVDRVSPFCPVWVSEVSTIDQEYQMIQDLGVLFSRESAGQDIIRSLKLLDIQRTSEPLQVAYLIWKGPFMTIGGDTYISDRLKTLGLHNVYESERRYPEINLNDLIKRKVEVVFLSSEPYPFRMEDVIEIREQLGGIPVHLVDGEFFSWYGSRRFHLTDYHEALFAELKTSLAQN